MAAELIAEKMEKTRVAKAKFVKPAKQQKQSAGPPPVKKVHFQDEDEQPKQPPMWGAYRGRGTSSRGGEFQRGGRGNRGRGRGSSLRGRGRGSGY